MIIFADYLYAYILVIFLIVDWFFFFISKRKSDSQKWQARKLRINRRQTFRTRVRRTWVRSHAYNAGLASIARRALCTNKLNAFHRRPPPFNATSSLRCWLRFDARTLTWTLMRGLDSMYRSNKDPSKRPHALSRTSSITARIREQKFNFPSLERILMNSFRFFLPVYL